MSCATTVGSLLLILITSGLERINAHYPTLIYIPTWHHEIQGKHAFMWELVFWLIHCVLMAVNTCGKLTQQSTLLDEQCVTFTLPLANNSNTDHCLL